jgi:hypothetical protein
LKEVGIEEQHIIPNNQSSFQKICENFEI